MEELTFKKTNGLVGIAKMNAENQWKKILGCVNKLYEYEQTGLTPNQINELKQDVVRLKAKTPSSFGKRLKEARLKNKITQINLANYLKVNRMAVVKWENEVTEPKVSMAKKIANYLNVDIAYLIGEENNEM